MQRCCSLVATKQGLEGVVSKEQEPAVRLQARTSAGSRSRRLRGARPTDDRFEMFQKDAGDGASLRSPRRVRFHHDL